MSVCDTLGCLDLSGGLSVEFVIINKALQWEEDVLKKEKIRFNGFHIKMSLLNLAFQRTFLGGRAGGQHADDRALWTRSGEMRPAAAPPLGAIQHLLWPKVAELGFTKSPCEGPGQRVSPCGA